MSQSPRVYIYCVDEHGTHRFLTTELDKKAAKDYCKKHAMAFKNRYDHYVYGSMSTEMTDWEIYKED